jgi:hypothetical protein
LNASNHVLQFLRQGSGGDLFSVQLPYYSQVTLEFDFLKTTPIAYGYIGTDHIPGPPAVCCTNEQWLWDSESGGAPLNAWTHVSITFSPFDNGGTRNFHVKLEQSGLNPFSPTAPPSAFFDNIAVTTPEPSSFLLFFGGAVAVATRKLIRRRPR